MTPSRRIQLLEARATLQEQTVRLAANRADVDQRARMLQLAQAVEDAAAIGDAQLYLRIARDIHTTLCDASGNEFLQRFMASLYVLSRQFSYVHLGEVNTFRGEVHTLTSSAPLPRRTKKLREGIAADDGFPVEVRDKWRPEGPPRHPQEVQRWQDRPTSPANCVSLADRLARGWVGRCKTTNAERCEEPAPHGARHGTVMRLARCAIAEKLSRCPLRLATKRSNVREISHGGGLKKHRPMKEQGNRSEL